MTTSKWFPFLSHNKKVAIAYDPEMGTPLRNMGIEEQASAIQIGYTGMYDGELHPRRHEFANDFQLVRDSPKF